MQRLEQQADSRLVQAADHAVFVDNVEIVGADSSKRGYEMMYLCHWTHPRWSGHPKEFQWVPASDMGPEKEDSDADYSGSAPLILLILTLLTSILLFFPDFVRTRVLFLPDFDCAICVT